MTEEEKARYQLCEYFHNGSTPGVESFFIDKKDDDGIHGFVVIVPGTNSRHLFIQDENFILQYQTPSQGRTS